MLNALFASLKTYAPGMGLAVMIAGIAHLLSLGHIALDPLVLSMLVSIILGNLLGPSRRLEEGITLSHTVFIPLGIALYGTQMDFQPLRTYGAGRIVQVLLMVLLAFLALVWISRRLGIGRKTGLLLAAGSAICGASAIMVLSPVIKAEKEDTSVALLAITVIGLVGVVLYPLVQETLGLTEQTYALLCGTTLYQMGQVKAAAALMGTKALALAVPVKLLRIVTLLPFAVAFSLLLGEKKGRTPYIPWFIVASIALAVVTALAPGLAASRAEIAPFVSFFFSIAIAGIGLSVNLEAIIDVGPRPLLAVFLGWVVLIGLFVVGITVVG